MIKKALEYINELKAPALNRIDEQVYSDKPLHRISYNPKAEPLELNTLSSLVDYIKAGLDDRAESFIHIKSPTRIEMVSKLDDERDREKLVVVNALVPDFSFNRFIEHESFCINLQSKFLDHPNNQDKALLLKFAGTVEAGTIAEYGDDGVTQKATVKTGIVSKGEALVPSPVSLKPYRTFIEVDQPLSSFIFRMKQDKYDGIQCALFEADGGAWKIEAMKNIKAYLEEQLADAAGIIIIA